MSAIDKRWLALGMVYAKTIAAIDISRFDNDEALTRMAVRLEMNSLLQQIGEPIPTEQEIQTLIEYLNQFDQKLEHEYDKPKMIMLSTPASKVSFFNRITQETEDCLCGHKITDHKASNALDVKGQSTTIATASICNVCNNMCKFDINVYSQIPKEQL